MIDLYRTQNYWETTRPHLEKKLAACGSEEERRELQEKIDEFHHLSYERVLYYQKLPRRAQQKDYSKYYDPRVKGSEELRHVPPFALIQHTVADFAEKYGDTEPIDSISGAVDPHYYEDYGEVSETFENDYSHPDNAKYLPSLNEEDSKEEDIREAHAKEETKELMNHVLVKDIAYRSAFYRLLPEKARVIYDFLLYIKKKPSKGDFTTAAIVAGTVFVLSLMQLQTTRSPYYITLGHLSLLSMLLTRGRPQEKSGMGAMMSQLRPTITWSPFAFRLGSYLTAAAVIPSTFLFFTLFSVLPIPLKWTLKLSAAYAFSLLPSFYITTQFQIYESKKNNGKIWKSFQENINKAKERQLNHLYEKDIDSVTLKLGESISDYMIRSNGQLPLYQEYTDQVNPEEILRPRFRYADQLEDEIKKTLGNNLIDYNARLYQSEELERDDKLRKASIQGGKKIRNLDKEVNQYKGSVREFFKKREERDERHRIPSNLNHEDLEEIVGVGEGFIVNNAHEKPWINNINELKDMKNEKRRNKLTPHSLKKIVNSNVNFIRTRKSPYEKESERKKVYIGEFGFRDYRPLWLIDLFGQKELDQSYQPIEENFLNKFAKKFGFYRLTNYKKDPTIRLTASELDK